MKAFVDIISIYTYNQFMSGNYLYIVCDPHLIG